jgi:hypothetical protein
MPMAIDQGRQAKQGIKKAIKVIRNHRRSTTLSRNPSLKGIIAQHRKLSIGHQFQLLTNPLHNRKTLFKN